MPTINLVDCPAPPIDDGTIKFEYSAPESASSPEPLPQEEINTEKAQDGNENSAGNSNVNGNSYQTAIFTESGGENLKVWGLVSYA